MIVNNYILSRLNNHLFYTILARWSSIELREHPVPVEYGLFDMAGPVSYIWKISTLKELLKNDFVVEELKDIGAITAIDN